MHDIINAAIDDMLREFLQAGRVLVDDDGIDFLDIDVEEFEEILYAFAEDIIAQV